VSSRLPDWLILGAAKSGTTSLAAWLAGHPEVYVTPLKEIHYFDREHARGEQFYRDHFADARPDQRAGEATPAYLWHPEVPARLVALLPDARLVALLRHPVDRAYSHYWHARNWGAALPSFPQLVADILAGDPHHEHLISRGYYDRQLQRYAALGADPLVLLAEDLASDPRSAFADTCRHLDVTPLDDVPVGSVHNAAHRRRSPRLHRAMERGRAWQVAPRLAQRLDAANTAAVEYPPLDPATRGVLLDHYAPHTARLRDRLGLPLTGWDA
jgi:hypothetical protein